MINTISLLVIRSDFMIFFDIFVRLSDLDFIRLKLSMHSVWIAKWYWLPSDLFFVSSGKRSPLRLDHATVRAYDRVCYFLCVDEITDRRRINVSRTRCLMTTMRLSLHCIYFGGPIRRSVCDTVVSRTTVKDTAYGKPLGVRPWIL